MCISANMLEKDSAKFVTIFSPITKKDKKFLELNLQVKRIYQSCLRWRCIVSDRINCT